MAGLLVTKSILDYLTNGTITQLEKWGLLYSTHSKVIRSVLSHEGDNELTTGPGIY